MLEALELGASVRAQRTSRARPPDELASVYLARLELDRAHAADRAGDPARRGERQRRGPRPRVALRRPAPSRSAASSTMPRPRSRRPASTSPRPGPPGSLGRTLNFAAWTARHKGRRLPKAERLFRESIRDPRPARGPRDALREPARRSPSLLLREGQGRRGRAVRARRPRDRRPARHHLAGHDDDVARACARRAGSGRGGRGAAATGVRARSLRREHSPACQCETPVGADSVLARPRPRGRGRPSWTRAANGVLADAASAALNRLARLEVGRLGDHGRRPLEAPQRLAERVGAQRALAVGQVLRLVPVRELRCPRSGCGTARPARAPRRRPRAPRRTARRR